jgi:hypothetical protein
MLSKGNAPTAAQKRFWDELTQMGCLLTGDEAEIDHCVGASAKWNGMNIGNWWVIALNPDVHRNGTGNRTSEEWKFIDRWCNPELWDSSAGHKKELFLAQMVRYKFYYQKEFPFPLEVLEAIMEYK